MVDSAMRVRMCNGPCKAVVMKKRKGRAVTALTLPYNFGCSIQYGFSRSAGAQRGHCVTLQEGFLLAGAFPPRMPLP